MEKQNFLIPNHRKLSSVETNVILEAYSLDDVSKLPRIKIKDPALSSLDAQIGDVVEIVRKSFAGENKYYRVVVE
jgi:DNA-directed RNA polymerase subunit H (RpoH/RPB5)